MKQLNLNLKSDFQFKLLAVREASEEKADDPESVYELMKEEAKADRECFWVLHLNARLKIIEKELVSMGVLNASLAHPREVFKKAIINGASAIITVHNHPSGSLQPSEDDIENWARLTKAGELLGIPVQDHLIISTKGYYSHSQSTKKHGQGGLDVTVKESKASYRTKTFQVVCHGKAISKHIDFYHAQDFIPTLFQEGRIDNSYTIEPIPEDKVIQSIRKRLLRYASKRRKERRQADGPSNRSQGNPKEALGVSRVKNIY